MEKIFLRILFISGLITLPFLFRESHQKDRLIVFFLSGFFANLFDDIVVTTERIAYPIRFLKKYSRKSLLFDYLIFPILCTIFCFYHLPV